MTPSEKMSLRSSTSPPVNDPLLMRHGNPVEELIEPICRERRGDRYLAPQFGAPRRAADQFHS